MATSIASSLGIGSGIDTTALVENLTAAQRASKEPAIVKREEANKAKVSALAEAANAIDSFATALSTLISGGSLFSQPSLSDSSAFSASAKPGSRLSGLNAQIVVEQLAQSQTLVSTPLADAAAPVGQGTLTLTLGTTSTAIVIDGTNDTLAGLADAINAKKAGVTASILNEAGSARLVLKSSATGEAQAFSLSVPAGTTSGLERFAYGAGVTGGMTQAQAAQDAILKVDGVQVKRGSNSIGDLVPGVQLDLKRADPTLTVSIGIERPTAAIKQTVADFVAAFNELESLLDDATEKTATEGSGVLRGDVGVRDLRRQLSKLSTQVLNSGAGFQTLAEIGVATNRDGSLTLNTARLDAALAQDPDGVEALFNPTQRSDNPLVAITSPMGRVKPGTYTLTDLVPANGNVGASGKINGVAAVSSGDRLVATAASGAAGLVVQVKGAVASAKVTIDPGLGGALEMIRDALKARSGPLEASNDRLDAEADRIADDRAIMEKRLTAYKDRLVTQFTAMDRRVSAFKATQSYLQQQIDIWTNSKD